LALRLVSQNDNFKSDTLDGTCIFVQSRVAWRWDDSDDQEWCISGNDIARSNRLPNIRSSGVVFVGMLADSKGYRRRETQGVALLDHVVPRSVPVDSESNPPFDVPVGNFIHDNVRGERTEGGVMTYAKSTIKLSGFDTAHKYERCSITRYQQKSWSS
jgi:hypothetical protein